MAYNSTDIVNCLKNNIRDKLYTQLDDVDEITQICENIDDIDNVRIDEITQLTKIYKEKIYRAESTIADLKTFNNEIELKYEKAKLQIKREHDSLKSILVMRSVLNILFRNLWLENKTNISFNIDYNVLAEKTEILKDKKLGEDDGTKIALAIKYDYLQLPIKKLCDYYIILNNKCHPPTKPIQDINDNIHTLKMFIKDFPNTKILNTILDIDILTEFEQEVHNHKKLFI